MGDRGQVKIAGIYLYTHWEASGLLKTVQAALRRGEGRWDTPEYLARIVLCEMVKGREMETNGYGIGSSQHFDIWRLVDLDVEQQVITDYNNGSVIFSAPFKAFIDMPLERMR